MGPLCSFAKYCHRYRYKGYCEISLSTPMTGEPKHFCSLAGRCLGNEKAWYFASQNAQYFDNFVLFPSVKWASSTAVRALAYCAEDHCLEPT